MIPRILNSPEMVRMGWALLHFLWQGTLIALALKGVLMLAKHSSSRLRYTLAFVALIVMAALPVLFLCKPQKSFSDIPAAHKTMPFETASVVPVAPKAIPVETAPDISVVHKSAPVETASVPGSTADIIPIQTKPNFRITVFRFVPALVPWITACWLIGMALLLLKTIVGVIQVRRLKRRAAALCETEAAVSFRRLAAQAKVDSVPIFESNLVSSPTVAGWLKPVVLLPKGVLEKIDRPMLDALVAHELAHIRRHDSVLNLFQIFIEDLLFISPAVWWVSRRVRAEREACCDDYAVGVCGDALVYVRALSQAEKFRSSLPVISISAAPLHQRIRRLTEMRIAKTSRIAAFCIALPAVTFILATAAGSILLATIPSQDSSSKVSINTQGGAQGTDEISRQKNGIAGQEAPISAPKMGDKGGLSDKIHDAAKQGDLAKVKAMLKDNPDLVAIKDSEGRTPLHRAVENGHKDVAALLLAQGANVNAKDKAGWTPLYRAVDRNKDMVELLLSQGADVNVKDHDGYAPLHEAAWTGQKAAVALLLANKAEVNVETKDGETPLHRAGNKDVAELLLSNSAEINAKDNQGREPLHGAAAGGHKDVVELLLAKGVDVNVRDKGGLTPLHNAAISSYDNVAVLFPLLAKGADVNARDNGGRTPLQMAAEYGLNKKMAKLLLAKEADANARDYKGQTPLHWAAVQMDWEDVVALLLAKGADVNARDYKGQTPLHTMVSNFNKKAAKLLLTHGGDVNAKDKDGETPLSLASKGFDKDAIEFLRKHGGLELGMATHPSKTYTMRFGDLPGGLEIKYAIETSDNNKLSGTIKNTSPVPIGCSRLYFKSVRYQSFSETWWGKNFAVNLDPGASQDFSLEASSVQNDVPEKIADAIDTGSWEKELCSTKLIVEFKDKAESKKFPWGTVTGFPRNMGIRLSLENNSDQKIEIDWNESSLIDFDKSAKKIIHRLLFPPSPWDRSEPLPNSVVPPRAARDEEVNLRDNYHGRRYSPISDLIPQLISPESAQWAVNYYPGKKMSLILQLIIEGKKTPVTFDFEVQSMSAKNPARSPIGPILAD
jgi:ankyrin repeat protein/beta-lactamase regulating signal transducer with metallopeptidase domain